MGQAGGRGAGQQHMVGRLIDHLTAVLALLEGDACPGEGAVQQDVDLVEGKPVVHKAGVFFEAGLGVAGKAFQRFAAAPGAVLLHQTHGDVKVAQGHQRLNAVLAALLEHIAVKVTPSGLGVRSSPWGYRRDQEMEVRNTFSPALPSGRCPLCNGGRSPRRCGWGNTPLPAASGGACRPA